MRQEVGARPYNHLHFNPTTATMTMPELWAELGLCFQQVLAGSADQRKAAEQHLDQLAIRDGT